MKRTKTMLPLLLLLLVATTLDLFGCLAPKKEEPYEFTSPQTKSVDLMVGISGQQAAGKESDDAFRQNQLRLAAELFTACYEAEGGGNVLISPLSIQLALAMTANGAVGQTREEMETLLGGEIPLETLNEYLKTYVASLTSGEDDTLKTANAIWFRDSENFTVKDTFLQTNADYYGAAAYKAPFDKTTLREINAWVNEKTDGMIPQVLDEMIDDPLMCLVNAILFDAEWRDPYEEKDTKKGTFTALNGETEEATMLHSTESRYLSSGKAVGFLKKFKGYRYTFAAILPNEGIAFEDYLAVFDGEELSALLESESGAVVYAAMPCFDYDTSLTMNDVLAELGMPTAFSSEAADFSELGRSTEGNLHISRVIHKTHVEIGPRGARAGAATVVEVTDTGVMISPEEPKRVTLDRPFLFLILDNETNTPLFVGALTSLS